MKKTSEDIWFKTNIFEQKDNEDVVFVDEELLVGRLSAARVKNCPLLAESLRTVCVQKLGGEVLTMMLY